MGKTHAFRQLRDSALAFWFGWDEASERNMFMICVNAITDQLAADERQQSPTFTLIDVEEHKHRNVEVKLAAGGQRAANFTDLISVHQFDRCISIQYVSDAISSLFDSI